MNRFLYWALMFLILVICNAATIVWIVGNFVWAETVEWANKTYQISWFDQLTNTHKALVYLFMGVGFIMSVCFVKWLFIDTITQLRDKAKEKKKDLYKKFKKEYE